MSTSTTGQALYSQASRVPLIKSHVVSLPPPVQLPTDLHPLPPDVRAYFVYPFSLESYVLDGTARAELEALHQRHQQTLRDREEQKKSDLRKVAPGWEGSVMVPNSSRNQNQVQTQSPISTEPVTERNTDQDYLDSL